MFTFENYQFFFSLFASVILWSKVKSTGPLHTRRSELEVSDASSMQGSRRVRFSPNKFIRSFKKKKLDPNFALTENSSNEDNQNEKITNNTAIDKHVK